MSEQQADLSWRAIELLLPISFAATAFWQTGNGWIAGGTLVVIGALIAVSVERARKL
jgi:hypothetical protein